MGRKRRSQLDGIDEINMTPLIDLTFLLLIIFMITAPLLENGINVSTPEMNANELPDDITSKSLVLDDDGKIVFEKVAMTREQLLAELKELKARDPKAMVLLRGGKKRAYGEVIDLLDVVNSSGFSNITLVTTTKGK